MHFFCENSFKKFESFLAHEYILGQKFFYFLPLIWRLVKNPPTPSRKFLAKYLSPLQIENEDFRFRCDTCGKMVRYSQAAFKNHLSLHETGKLACAECQDQGDQGRNS
jgi:hypothetical protein